MKKLYKYAISNIYIYIVAASILPLLYYTTPYIFQMSYLTLFFWIALVVVSDFKSIKILRLNQTTAVTMSTCVQICIFTVLGIEKSVWIVILATLIVEIISKKPIKKMLFNAGQYGICTWAGALTFHILRQSQLGLAFSIMDILAFLVAASVYLLINLLLVAVVVCLTTDIKISYFLQSEFNLTFINFYTMVPISIAMSLIYDERAPYLLLIMFPPILMADQALRKYYDIQQETQQTLKLVAEIIDKRDSYTYTHSMRVAEYAKKITDAMGLGALYASEIEMAGQVHDLGKISIEDCVLRKPGKLTNEEFTQIKRHPQVGYDLLNNLKHYKNGANYVLYHHERLDGSGYPSGLFDKDIPLGAKILAVADSYDAMTSDRPYRHALPINDAVAELRKHSGTQFDPEVVNAFVEVLKQDYNYLEV